MGSIGLVSSIELFEWMENGVRQCSECLSVFVVDRSYDESDMELFARL